MLFRAFLIAASCTGEESLHHDTACINRRILEKEGEYLNLQDILSGLTSGLKAVSYTHLDVYKRQDRYRSDVYL